jgi:putative PIN family toxin of toxin-antitoxin system
VIVVIDATTLASMAIALPGGTLAMILAAWRGGLFTVVVSDHVLGELRRTLSNTYFSRRIAPRDAQVYLDFMRDVAQHTDITVSIFGVATHPEDDLVLATALSGRANFLVTSDRRFRSRVPSYQGVTLISPAEFLAVLNDPIAEQ